VRQSLRVIIIEDRVSDAELMLHELNRAGFEPQWVRMESEEEFTQALPGGADVILADYNLPQFNAPRALEILRKTGQDIPFIVVTGSVSEEIAVEMIKGGASDYLLKDRPARLGPAVTAALKDKRLRDVARAAEEALRASEERLQMAVTSSNTGLWDWDLRTNEVIFSEIWKRQIGYAPDGLRNHFDEWESRLHPEDRERVLGVVKRYLAKPAGHYQCEFRLRHKDGSYRWILSQGAAVDGDGPPSRMLGSHIDITSLKQTEQELRDRYELERLLFQELDHRVRNNLAALLALVDMTRKGTDNVEDFAAAIGGRVQAMSSIHALLSQSHWTYLDLSALIDATASGPGRRQIILKGPPVMIPAHQVNALGIVLYELVTNSRKHGALKAPEGRVSIHWTVEPGQDGTTGLTLRWVERGGPAVTGAPKPGVGTTLIQGLAKADLRGSVKLTYPPEGVDHTLGITLTQTDTPESIQKRLAETTSAMGSLPGR
jgi:PAS domain S-box-containing protein